MSPASRFSLHPSISTHLGTCTRSSVPLSPFVFRPSRPTLAWTSISASPAPWKCHIPKRRRCSNLKGRLRRHGGETAHSLPSITMALCSLLSLKHFAKVYLCNSGHFPYIKSVCPIVHRLVFFYTAFNWSLPDLWDLCNWCHSKESVSRQFVPLSCFHPLCSLECVSAYECVRMRVSRAKRYKHMHRVSSLTLI